MSLESVAVLDAGSHTFKAGLATALDALETPSVVTPSAVVDTRADVSAGVAGTSGRGARAAVEGGEIIDWDAYEAILDHILYDKLGWKVGEEGGLLVSEALFTPRAARERLAQLIFEHNNAAGLLMADAPALALAAAGKLAGCCVDFGHTKTDIAAVVEGQLHAPSARRLPLGMRSLSLALRQRLAGRGAGADEASLDGLREAVLRVAETPDAARPSGGGGQAAGGGVAETFTLPDGQAVSVAPSEGAALGELLLDASTLAADAVPTAAALHSACFAVQEAPARKAALEALLVCGGGSAAAGLPLRLLREFRLLLAPSASPGLAHPPDFAPPETHRFAAWAGGAILAKIAFQQSQYVSKLDYEEVGPMAVHRKCS